MKEQVEERLRFYDEGIAPKKNITAMQVSHLLLCISCWSGSSHLLQCVCDFLCANDALCCTRSDESCCCKAEA